MTSIRLERPVELLGGWGYNNLGDEAILAGYVELFSDTELVVRSIDPKRTSQAQRGGLEVLSEARSPRGESRLAVVCGGGYLNGNWSREIGSKLDRLTRGRESSQTIVHGVEIRRLADGPYHDRAVQLLDGASVAVRDHKSAAEVEALNLPAPTVLPDGISLLFPHLDKYHVDIPELHGKIILNLLDISERNDASEAEIDTSAWRDYVEKLILMLGDRAVGMVIGGGDYRFLRSLPAMAIVEPSSVKQLISILGSASGVLSVRMHPALLASALGTPVIGIPYCGKVRPTLERIGVEAIIDDSLDASTSVERLHESPDPTRWSAQWMNAYVRNRDWIETAVLNKESVRRSTRH